MTSNTAILGLWKRKSKIFRGLRPLDPRQGLCPCTPARGPKAGPWTPPKIGSRLRARYVRSAHMFAQKKSDPQQFKKIDSRFALAMCATRTCLPPHNQSLPPFLPPHFLNPGAATDGTTLARSRPAVRENDAEAKLRNYPQNTPRVALAYYYRGLHCMLLVSYIQQYFNTSITVLTNQVWKLLIALFKVPNTGAFTVLPFLLFTYYSSSLYMYSQFI